MLRSYKTEINPTEEQKQIINKTIGTCRFIYNFYISHNIEIYKQNGGFVSGIDFSKWLNNVYLKENPEYLWIKEVSSKSLKKSIMNADNTFRRFFKREINFPKFKKKGKSDVKMYFVKNNPKDCACERHRINIPTLGWVRIKEKGYIPTNSSTHIIKSGTVSCKAGRYYVSVLVEEKEHEKPALNKDGIGIDLGLKDFAILSNGRVYSGINKTKAIKKLEKQIKREQRCLSRKYENSKHNKSTYRDMQRQKAKLQRLHNRLGNMRTDYVKKCVSEIAKTKPSYITIEDLNIKGMTKNKHISKAIISQNFGEFKKQLEKKCKELGIELRIADKWFPSSKMCHECGNIKADLKLSDRKYVCECGYCADRDYNASLNLRDCTTYKIA